MRTRRTLCRGEADDQAVEGLAGGMTVVDGGVRDTYRTVLGAEGMPIVVTTLLATAGVLPAGVLLAGEKATSTQKFIPEPLVAGNDAAEPYTPSPPGAVGQGVQRAVVNPAGGEVIAADVEVTTPSRERHDVDRVGRDGDRCREVRLLPPGGGLAR